MRKAIIVPLLLLLVSACQQKEEPMPQYQFPSGPNQLQGGPLQPQDNTKLLQEAVKKDPSNLQAWIQLGNTMMDSSRFAQATDAYEHALKLDPKNVDVRVDLGTCYRNSGKPDIAVKEYRKALEMAPNHLNAHKNLAVVLISDTGDKAQAIKEFEKYLTLAPNAPDADQIKQEVDKLKASK